MNTLERAKYTDEEKMRAAYALNMCTVSVSQIVDYHDSYVLEQEYDAILNNLNLEKIPKDEALLNILMEILNTVTFFRIQEIKKAQIENAYQQQMKNAIWSAVPNLSVVAYGSPVSIALSLATQVGTGYMNYRKAKAAALAKKETSDTELQITAIEQFNALRRELFSTAWRLADEYDFPDQYRLTEKQIKQYNDILMDTDEYRKYARLEAIQSKFAAYPPFWYFFAHTALYVSTSTNDKEIKEQYRNKAKEHFEKYLEVNRYNILREDSITASANLEYVDLLLLDKQPDFNKVQSIIKDAVEKAGNDNDILQLCAFAYLRTGKSNPAARLLKILVNEGYNATTNATLLSRLYVSQYINSKNQEAQDAYANYEILKTRVDPSRLFPMPREIDGKPQAELNKEFFAKQKLYLQKQYLFSINEFDKQCEIKFNKVLPAPTKPHNPDIYFGCTRKAKMHRIKDAREALENTSKRDNYIDKLSHCNFRYGYVDVINAVVAGLEELSCFRGLINHDILLDQIKGTLAGAKSDLCNLQKKLNEGTFDVEDYEELVGEEYSYQQFLGAFFSSVQQRIGESIWDLSEDHLDKLNRYEFELVEFCSKNHLPDPIEYIRSKEDTDMSSSISAHRKFFPYDLLGEDDSEISSERRAEMVRKSKGKKAEIILDVGKAIMYFEGENQFETYFANSNLNPGSDSIFLLKQSCFAIIDDRNRSDRDILLCTDGVRLVFKGRVHECVDYGEIEYFSSGNVSKLLIGTSDEYSSKSVSIEALSGLIRDLKSQN